MTISIDAGRATCCRCGQPIEPGEPGDLGHSPDRTRYSRPPASALQSCDVLGSTEADAVRIELEASPRLLRSRCARAAIRLWRSDRSRSGLVVRRQTDLEQNGVIFPKVFRRLTEYLRRQGGDLSEFLPWLEVTREQVLELPTTNFTHFDDVLDVYANTIRLRPRPEELVFVSAKSTSTAAAPWLAV